MYTAFPAHMPLPLPNLPSETLSQSYLTRPSQVPYPARAASSCHRPLQPIARRGHWLHRARLCIFRDTRQRYIARCACLPLLHRRDVAVQLAAAVTAALAAAARLRLLGTRLPLLLLHLQAPAAPMAASSAGNAGTTCRMPCSASRAGACSRLPAACKSKRIRSPFST
jgi:hypothetical protein